MLKTEEGGGEGKINEPDCCKLCGSLIRRPHCQPFSSTPHNAGQVKKRFLLLLVPLLGNHCQHIVASKASSSGSSWGLYLSIPLKCPAGLIPFCKIACLYLRIF